MMTFALLPHSKRTDNSSSCAGFVCTGYKSSKEFVAGGQKPVRRWEQAQTLSSNTRFSSPSSLEDHIGITFSTAFTLLTMPWRYETKH